MQKAFLLALMTVLTVAIAGCGTGTSNTTDAVTTGTTIIVTGNGVAITDSTVQSQQRYAVTGRVSYYNYEKDFSSGDETASGKDHRAILLTLQVGNPIDSTKELTIPLGCMSGGDEKVLYRDILEATGDVTQTTGTYGLIVNQTTSISLPTSLDTQIISANITKPIFLYNLDVDGPDHARPWTCFGDSDIKDIQIISTDVSNVSASSDITMIEVAAHATKADCWTAIDGKVYDITNAIDKHPGGEKILKGCGVDGTALFSKHPSKAKEALQQFYKGDVVK